MSYIWPKVDDSFWITIFRLARNYIDYKIHFFVHNEVYPLQSFKTTIFLQTDVCEKKLQRNIFHGQTNAKWMLSTTTFQTECIFDVWNCVKWNWKLCDHKVWREEKRGLKREHTHLKYELLFHSYSQLPSL